MASVGRRGHESMSEARERRRRDLSYREMVMRDHMRGMHTTKERSCPLCNPEPRDGDGQEMEGQAQGDMVFERWWREARQRVKDRMPAQ